MPDSANGSRELDKLGGGTAGGRRIGRGRDGDERQRGQRFVRYGGDGRPRRGARGAAFEHRHRDEDQRDRRLGDTRRLSWPAIVLAGGVLLSLAANLAQAQPTAWGRIAAAYRAAGADDLTRGTSPCLPTSTPS